LVTGGVKSSRIADSTDERRSHPIELLIGLLGHSVNSDNLGVGALTVSHIAILERVCRDLGLVPKLRLFGLPGGPNSYVVADNLVTIPMRTRTYLSPSKGLYSAVRECDVAIDITGGDSFADIYGWGRFLRVALAKTVVLLARRPLILAPQTIGPFRRAWTRKIAAALMRRSRIIASRDDLTSEFIRRLGLKSHLVDSTDVAFRLPYEPPRRSGSGAQRVGLNISGLLFNGGYTRDNMFRLSLDYPMLARTLVRHFTDQRDCELHLIGHVNSNHIEVEDDYRVAQELQREFPSAILAPRFSTPSEAKSYIATMDFFAGSRMHACIAALSSGVPVLPIAYSRKFWGVFGGLGYTHVADCQTESIDAVLRKTADAFERRDELKENVKTAIAKAEEKLTAYEAVLAECFLQAIGKRA
jgi:colanic acid/amylovoran biosynthesis protein